ncbi:MAG: hypothetical protein ACFBZ9_16585 [Sphingomonadales bacterium]
MAQKVGIVTGLQLEAEIARGFQSADVLCLGPGPMKALQAAEHLVEKGATALMSFGIAGGLEPGLKAGDIIASPDALGAALSAKGHSIATIPDPAMTPQDKAALYKKSGACAVDMETSAVRDVAQAHGVPFLILRAICDEAGATIPDIALKGVSTDGKTQPVRVAAGLLTRPGDVPALIHLGKQQKKAVSALQNAVRMLEYRVDMK